MPDPLLPRLDRAMQLALNAEAVDLPDRLIALARDAILRALAGATEDQAIEAAIEAARQADYGGSRRDGESWAEFGQRIERAQLHAAAPILQAGLRAEVARLRAELSKMSDAFAADGLSVELLRQRLAAAEGERERVRVAMKGYPDSNLGSLAEYYVSRCEAAEGELDRLRGELGAAEQHVTILRGLRDTIRVTCPGCGLESFARPDQPKAGTT